MKPTVYVIDDDDGVRDSLQWLFESAGLRVSTFATAGQFLTDIIDHKVPNGCLLIDLRLPGMNGLELLEELQQREIAVPVIMVTGHGDVPVAVRAMKMGAVDFIEKPFNDQTLLGRVQDALAIHAEHCQAAADLADLRKRVDRLTPREVEVMNLVVSGRLNKQIAADLGLSHKTIEVHRAHVMEKMAADSLADLVRMAMLLEGHDQSGTGTGAANGSSE